MFKVDATDAFKAIAKISDALVERGMTEPLRVLESRLGYDGRDYLVTACGEYAIVCTTDVEARDRDLDGGGYAPYVIASLSQSDWKPSIAATGWGWGVRNPMQRDPTIYPVVSR